MGLQEGRGARCSAARRPDPTPPTPPAAPPLTARRAGVLAERERLVADVEVMAEAALKDHDVSGG